MECKCNPEKDKALEICCRIKEAIKNTKHFVPFEKYEKESLITELKFKQILQDQLNGIINFTHDEITTLIKFLCIKEGCIDYGNFCAIVHFDHAKSTKGCKGLAEHEKIRLCDLLIKISNSIRLREIILLPYFKDYDLIAKNNGTIRFEHFSRVLHILGLLLSTDDYLLLLKAFMRDSYTVSYVDFVDKMSRLCKHLDENRLENHEEDILTNYPGYIINAELQKIPRPEVGTICLGELFMKDQPKHQVLKRKKYTKDICEIVNRIQKHVYENRIRVKEFFEVYDPFHSGYIPEATFIRCIDILGISKLDYLPLSNEEIRKVCDLYRSERHPQEINWKRFEDHIDTVFTIKDLDKNPLVQVSTSPPSHIENLPRDGLEDWQCQTKRIRDVCEEALFKIRAKVMKRHIYLEQFFRDMDPLISGHVSLSQMRRVIFATGVFLTDEEVLSLDHRYNDEQGFNYRTFLKEVDPVEPIIPEFERYKVCMDAVNRPKMDARPRNDELDIAQVLSKIKSKVVRHRLRLIEFMSGFDTHRELCIPRNDFIRGLNTCTIDLTKYELDVICRVFQSPLRPRYVDYRRFCQVIEESFYQPCLERAPLLIPLQHYPSEDGCHNNLNLAERCILSNALKKLSKQFDQKSNLQDIFTDYDSTYCGTVSKEQFLRALTNRGAMDLVTLQEFDAVCKAFSIERGLRMEVDYRSFLKALDILYVTEKKYPF